MSESIDVSWLDPSWVSNRRAEPIQDRRQDLRQAGGVILPACLRSRLLEQHYQTEARIVWRESAEYQSQTLAHLACQHFQLG